MDIRNVDVSGVARSQAAQPSAGGPWRHRNHMTGKFSSSMFSVSQSGKLCPTRLWSAPARCAVLCAAECGGVNKDPSENKICWTNQRLPQPVRILMLKIIFYLAHCGGK